ncbi:hypothetical protein FRB90_008495 [Tulasnella sp. 427]|nr:hypothetical protein FRB90_008495 [Tulasnella sp. 427]
MRHPTHHVEQNEQDPDHRGDRNSKEHSGGFLGWIGLSPEPPQPTLQEYQRLKDTVFRLDKDLKWYETQTKEKDIKLKQKDIELKEKDIELEDLKKTLCMYDACAEADIIKKVDSINTTTSKFLRDTARSWVKSASKVPEELVTVVVPDDDLQHLREVIGTSLFKALMVARLEKATAAYNILQFAWQASIVAVVTKVLGSFSAGLAASPEGSAIDKTLQMISVEVMKREVQPAYGRWRFLTYRHSRGIVPEEQAIEIYVNDAMKTCRTAGQVLLKNRCPAPAAFATVFEPKLKDIIRHAFQLLTDIQESMMTTNFEPYVPPSGIPFEPKNMDVNPQDKTDYAGDVVVCVTGVGLLYSRKNGRERTNEVPMKDVFKKPKVLTEANLKDIVA